MSKRWGGKPDCTPAWEKHRLGNKVPQMDARVFKGNWRWGMCRGLQVCKVAGLQCCKRNGFSSVHPRSIRVCIPFERSLDFTRLVRFPARLIPLGRYSLLPTRACQCQQTRWCIKSRLTLPTSLFCRNCYKYSPITVRVGNSTTTEQEIYFDVIAATVTKTAIILRKSNVSNLNCVAHNKSQFVNETLFDSIS